jgi:hypothetical protein
LGKLEEESSMKMRLGDSGSAPKNLPRCALEPT